MASKPSDKLTDQARAFVVQRLAMFDPPELVAKAVREEFGVTITRQSVQFYDPESYAGRKLSKKWRALFEATRKAHIDGQAQIGIKSRTVRVMRLQRMADKAEGQGNLKLAAELLEQAAKEEGDAYTNTRVVKGAVAVTTPKSLADFYGGNLP